MQRPVFFPFSAIVTVLLLAGGPAYAQNQSARQVLSFLMTNQAVPTADFAKDQEASEATRDTVARALLVELATLPMTTSSGGFNYRFNPALGTLERATETFGPLHVDRAATAGRGQFSLSISYRRSTFGSLDGRDLTDGSLVTTANKFRDETTPFDVEALALTLQTNTVIAYGNYGAGDRIDIGAAVPVVFLSLSGQRLNTYRGVPLVQARGTATTGGIADIALRTKIQLLRRPGYGMAADVELRLPTGDPDNLRGAGETALKASGIASFGEGPIEGHVNGGVTFGGISRERAVAGAVAAALTDRVSVSAEATVRQLQELSGIREVSQPHPLIAGVETIRLLPTGGSTTTLTTVGGVRWNVASTWLINAYVVMPMTNGGLRSRVTPVLSVDYSFVR